MPVLSVGDNVLSCVPGLRIVATSVSGIDNGRPYEEVDALLTACWSEVRELRHEHPAAQDNPRIAAWRTALRELGIQSKKFPSAIESMVRRAYKVPEPFRLNPLADFLHALSLRHQLPLGGFDATDIDGTLELRRTREGDTFHSLDAPEAVPVEPDEVAYVWQNVVLTRHFMWRQSAQALLAPKTTDAIIVVEVPPVVDDAGLDKFLQDLADGLADHFGNPVTPHVVATDGVTVQLP